MGVGRLLKGVMWQQWDALDLILSISSLSVFLSPAKELEQVQGVLLQSRRLIEE